MLLLLPSTTKCYSNANKLLTAYGEWLKIWVLQYYSVVLLKYYPVLQSTTLPQSTAPVLLYYKVLVQYYSALQSNCYSSAALSYKVLERYEEYYRVLLQYYPVLQSITPVLPCATSCCSSTAPECYSSSVTERRGTGTPAFPSAGVAGTPALPSAGVPGTPAFPSGVHRHHGGYITKPSGRGGF